MQVEEHETREGDGWRLMLGDCVERLADVDDETVGLTVFSPPFPACMFTPTHRTIWATSGPPTK